MSSERYNKGKAQLSYVLDFPHALTEMSRVLEYGAKKYAPRNWQKGSNYRQCIDALMRHVVRYMNGETIDDESNGHHLAHAMINLAMLIEWEYLGVGEDDLTNTETDITALVDLMTNDYSNELHKVQSDIGKKIYFTRILPDVEGEWSENNMPLPPSPWTKE